MATYVIRMAEQKDEPILREMLYWAVFVPAGTPPPDPSIVTRSELCRYVTGWGRSGDDGVIAVTSASDPVGAAWMRMWSDDDRGYGFIDVATAELSVAVRPECRGRGIGTRMLRHLLRRADQVHQAVSLSVSFDNPAVRLYERLGFAAVSNRENAVVMRRLRSAG